MCKITVQTSVHMHMVKMNRSPMLRKEAGQVMSHFQEKATALKQATLSMRTKVLILSRSVAMS
jgi:hypothetical protein